MKYRISWVLNKTCCICGLLPGRLLDGSSGYPTQSLADF